MYTPLSTVDARTLGAQAKSYLQNAGIPLLNVIFITSERRAMVTIDFIQDIDRTIRAFTERHHDFEFSHTKGTSIHFRQKPSFHFNLN